MILGKSYLGSTEIQKIYLGADVVYEVGGGGFTAEYDAILAAGTTNGYTLPSALEQATQNTLIEHLKGYGLWDGIDAMFYFKGSGDSDFKGINWKNPTSNITSESANGGALIYSATGLKGDAVNYLDLGWTPTVDAVNYTQTDFGFIYELVTASVTDTALLENSGTNTNTRLFAGNTFQQLHNASNLCRDIFNGGQVGVNVAEVLTDTIYSSLNGGTVKVAGGKTPAVISDQTYRLLKNGSSGKGDCELGLFVIGASLGGAQANHLDFTNAIKGIAP